MNDIKEVEEKINKIIAFINWKGASFDTKKKKVIKELSLVKDYFNKSNNTSKG